LSAITAQKKEVETIDDSLMTALLVVTVASLMIMIVTGTGKEAVAVAVAVGAAASCIGYSSVLRRHWVAMMIARTTTTIEKLTPRRLDTIN